MNNKRKKERIFPDLTLRGLIIGLIGSILITSSSMYVALRLGALPWPTLFAAVLSMSVLKLWKDSTIQEINVTHTIMSAGAMVAGGLAFTIPGIWIINPDTPFEMLPIMAVTLSGALLGVLFTWFHRKNYIVEHPLPFPMGTAASRTLQVGDAGGKHAALLFVSMGVSAVFTFLRDRIMAIPAAISWKMPGKNTPGAAMWLSPMALGIGFIVGPLYTGVWFLGCILGYFLLIPLGLSTGLFADAAAADLFRQNLGIGLMVGTGLGIILKGIHSAWTTRSSATAAQRRSVLSKVLLPSIIIALILWLLAGIALWQVLLSIALIWIVTSMAAMLTGQTAINPMEIFGILVLLAVSLIRRPEMIQAFFIAGAAAVACGLTGDVMNDFKAGKDLGTDPRSQLAAEGAGALLGAVISVIVLAAMKQAFGGFGTEQLPAPQAAAVSSMIQGLGDVTAFLIGCSAGAILYLLRLPSTTLGLGVYLPTSISTIVAAGGLIRFGIERLCRKDRQESLSEQGSIIASGFLGGEGIIGVTLAILSIF